MIEPRPHSSQHLQVVATEPELDATGRAVPAASNRDTQHSSLKEIHAELFVLLDELEAIQA